MKTKMWMAAFFVLLFVSSGVAQSASKSKTMEVKIKTSAQCGMCKDRLEGALAYEKGVKKSVLDLNEKVLTVTYLPSKTDPDKIRTKISMTGYDADNVPADKAAYDALPACCKKKAPTRTCAPGCSGKH